VTIGLLSMALMDIGVKAAAIPAGQVRIPDRQRLHQGAHRQHRRGQHPRDLDNGTSVVVAGFQGVDEAGNITTLGRGGSDTSAVAIAAALKADECQIYTDVDGVYTTDPRIVPEARRLETITFEEMLEMASLGSKVLQIRSVEFAGKYKVKLRVLSSLEELGQEGPGTLITFEEDIKMGTADHFRHRLQSRRGQAHRARRAGPPRHRLPDPRAGGRGQHRRRHDHPERRPRRHRPTSRLPCRAASSPRRPPSSRSRSRATSAREITGDNKIAKVSVVGVGMRSHVGIASKMFRTLAEEGINIQMISTSEIKISVVIDEKYLELAVRVLHKAFELDQVPA
jgi:aspartate kinase